jgi:ribosomal protein S18 acetylase RimI-like enzyme
MFTLKKVLSEDFEHIYPLLLGFNNPRLSKEDWRQLFINHWNNEENYFGFALVDEEKNKYVGFMGLIFSTRQIDGRAHKFASMTSWIIDNDYRRKGLGRKLFDEVLKLKEYTITDFTASANTFSMLKQSGFKELETSILLIRPSPMLSTLAGIFTCKPSIVSNPKKVADYLNEEDFTIFNDHLKFKCFNLILKGKKETGTCYLVLHKHFRGRYPYLKIHYISNVDFFAKYIPRVIVNICLRFRVIGVIVDKRIMKNHSVKQAIERKLPYMSVFKSGVLEKSHLNDSLYSEFLLLNL